MSVLVIGVSKSTVWCSTVCPHYWCKQVYSLVLCSLSSFIGVRQAQAKEWGEGGGGRGEGQISEGGI